MAKLFRGNKTFTVGAAASVMALGENRSRTYLVIQNKGSEAVYVQLGQAATTDNGLMIEAGKAWEPPEVPGDSINLISASGDQAVVIVEV